MIFNPNELPATFKNLCGPGVDGEITETGNRTRTLLYCTEYENPSYTITSSGKGIVIFAQKRIVIGGILDVTGKGAAGGIAPTGSPGNGNPGENGRLLSSGGDGGPAYQKTGGAGGVASDSVLWYDHFLFSALWDMVKDDYLAGPGGGSGATYNTQHPGGDGGDGGGYIVLFAPHIIVTGTLTVNGVDGEDTPTSGGASDDGGGGGGGSGGVIWLVGRTIDTSTGTMNKAGGAGGVSERTDCNGLPGAEGAEIKVLV